MAVDLTVPQLGESVAADEPLVALETDKVTVDVPAPAGGALAQIARKEGDRVKVGEVLGSISPGEPARPPSTARGSVPAAAPSTTREPVRPQPVQRSPERNAGDGRGALLTPVARRVA